VDDVNRTSMYALRRLAEPGFRERLKAVAADGQRPILPKLLSERLIDVAHEVCNLGGAANVLVPLPHRSGCFILSLHVTREASFWAHPKLSPEVTLGVFIARAIEDGTSGVQIYSLPDACSTGIDTASAEFVGVAE